MAICHALDWFLLGALMSIYAISLAIALWRTRDMLRESPKGEHSDKEPSDGK